MSYELTHIVSVDHVIGDVKLWYGPSASASHSLPAPVHSSGCTFHVSVWFAAYSDFRIGSILLRCVCLRDEATRIPGKCIFSLFSPVSLLIVYNPILFRIRSVDAPSHALMNRSLNARTSVSSNSATSSSI